MVPSKITAGDSLEFSVSSFIDAKGRSIAPPSWTAKLALRGSTEGTLNATANSNWEFSIPASDTLNLPVGKLYFQLYAENGSERVTINQGQVEILRNLAAASGEVDNRSQTQIDLEQVQTAIRSIMQNGGVAEYSIGGRRIKKYDLADLLALETQLKVRLAREQKAEKIKQGLGNPHKTLVRFK